MSKQHFWLRELVLIAAAVTSAAANADTPTGWTNWLDTQIVSTSSPTAVQDPSAHGQGNVIIFTDAHFALQSIEPFAGSAPNPILIAPPLHYDPACYYNGRAVCFAFQVSPARLAGKVLPPSDGKTAVERAEATYAGASKNRLPPQAASVACVTLDCQVAALPGNAAAELSVFATTTANPAWKPLGSVATSWATLVADSKFTIHALSIGSGYALQERTSALSSSYATWSAWQNLGGRYRGAPGCYQSGASLHCYAPTYEGNMAHLVFDGAQWQPAKVLQQALPSTPSIVSWTAGVQELFYVANGHLIHQSGQGEFWTSPEDLGGDISGNAQCISLRFALRCYARFNDGHIWGRLWIADVGNIAGFAATPNSITAGGSSTLKWSITGCPVPGCTFAVTADQLNLPPGSTTTVVSVAGASGSVQVSAKSDTRYTLSLNDSFESKTRTADVKVSAAPMPQPQPQPPANGISKIEFWNCHGTGNSVTVWTSASGSSWNQQANVPDQFVNGGCGSTYGPAGATLPIPPGVWSYYLITDDGKCSDPTELECILVPAVPVFGSASGPVIIDNIF